uniref:Uncharacterized protein n=1 Tax=Avena sativa TaxID=4498 RepID=A0ACD5YUY2_AVESA
MELLLFPSRATVSRSLLRTAPFRRAGATAFRPSSSSGNVEVTTDTTATTTSVAKNNRQEWRAGGTPFGLGLDLSEEMRGDMMWRMLAPPAAAVAAEAALLALLNSGAAAVDAPAWAGKAGSAVLFAAGLLGSQYGFFSSRWDATEEAGSVVGWELAVRHWSALSVAMDSSVEDEDEEEEDDDEWEYYEDDEEEEDD